MKFFVLVLWIFMNVYSIFGQTPISLHPENPHYFLFRGKPTILITSAEHYGIVLNSELDHKLYLRTLKDHGFNQTRIFSGAFCEGDEYDTDRGKPYRWEDMQNTLSPRPGKLITPWKRSDEPGYANGGNKFDLSVWDELYFKRLKDFCREADSQNVVVEIVLFTANYAPKTWLNSPLNARNNINSIGDVPYNEFHLLKHESLITHQVRMVEKIVQEVNEFDNVYFEVCNEPYWMKGIPALEPSIKEQQFLPEIAEWEKLIIKTNLNTELRLPKKHLIAQNIANSYSKVNNLNEGVSILNFHYAYPPAAVTDNYQLNRPVAFDETRDGCKAPDRRREAWAFIMAGGAVYSNLDWSFANDDLTGMGRNPSGRRQSGKEVREQLMFLRTIMDGYDFVHARPIDDQFRNGLPEGASLYGLMLHGKDYIIYCLKTKLIELNELKLPAPEGVYSLKFLDPVTSKIISQQELTSKANNLDVNMPLFPDDLAIRITRLKK